jgi:hypothetical protein
MVTYSLAAMTAQSWRRPKSSSFPRRDTDATHRLLNNINEGWHDFYMLLGTSSAALVALLFVAASIGAGFLTPERSTATRTFMSPVVFHYSTTLLMSLIALIPAHTPISLTVGIAAVAVAGLVYTTMVLVGLARASITDIADRFGYGLFPLAAYLAMLASAGLMLSRPPFGADILAAALLLLLAVNIRNAWDLMLAFARQVASKKSDT